MLVMWAGPVCSVGSEARSYTDREDESSPITCRVSGEGANAVAALEVKHKGQPNSSRFIRFPRISLERMSDHIGCGKGWEEFVEKSSSLGVNQEFSVGPRGVFKAAIK